MENSVDDNKMTVDLLLFYIDLWFPLSMPRLLPDLNVYMSNTEKNRWMSYKKPELLTLLEHPGIPSNFGVVRGANVFSFLSCFF